MINYRSVMVPLIADGDFFLYIAQKYFPKQIEWLVQVGELSLQKCRVQYGDIDKLACAGSYKNADTRFKATTFH